MKQLKLKQLVASDGHTLGLDYEGNVWVYEPEAQIWFPLSMEIDEHYDDGLEGPDDDDDGGLS